MHGVVRACPSMEHARPWPCPALACGRVRGGDHGRCPWPWPMALALPGRGLPCPGQRTRERIATMDHVKCASARRHRAGCGRCAVAHMVIRPLHGTGGLGCELIKVEGRFARSRQRRGPMVWLYRRPHGPPWTGLRAALDGLSLHAGVSERAGGRSPCPALPLCGLALPLALGPARCRPGQARCALAHVHVR